MNNIKLTLKWRITLFTIMIITLTSAILICTINYDIKRTMPEIKDTVMMIGGINPDNSHDGEVEYDFDDYISDENDSITIEMAIKKAESSIYWVSITAFILVVIIGGICTYFMVNKALIPIIELNKNIKKINEDNLTSNLQADGPNDEIKELTISFNKMIGKLENAFTSQKRFNSSVAHELKTPLAVIKTNIDVLKSSGSNRIEDYESTMSVVEKSVLKMNTIIETMLDIIKQENAPLNELVDVEEVLEDAVQDLKVIANKKDIELTLNIDNISDKIMGNEILLYRAFYNVIENGIKYNKINGTVNIFCCQKQNDFIEIKVSDTGKGIAENEYEEIFKPFYRCDGINTYSDNGVGLGLSLTESVIKLHGGEIKIMSKINEGSEFIFILPVYK